jgi:uncharacterized membrane protein YdbT with pleckstrin-like domain
LNSIERQLDRGGEQLLVSSRASASSLLFPMLIFVVIVGGVIYGIASWHAAPNWGRDAAIAICGATALYLIEQVMTWRARQFMVTSRRIVAREGLFHRRGREVPLESIAEVHYEQRLSERVRGRGVLLVTCRTGEALAPFYDVRRPRRIQQVIGDALARLRTAPGEERVTPSVPTPASLDELSELHRRGVITEREYDQQRSQRRGE